MDGTPHCSIRCRTAETPREQCECRCGGSNHGATATLTEFGTVAIEDSAKHPRTNPFTSLTITEDGVTTNTKVETLDESGTHSLAELCEGDRINVYAEYADDGWKLHKKVSIEAIQDRGVVVTKPDGFSTVIPAAQIPVDQFTA